MARTFIVTPSFKGDVMLGTEGDDMKVYIGKVAEKGPGRKLFFGGSKEFVSLIIGKRGSGKSYTLGTILEGLATKQNKTSISDHKARRAVLLLDPMGNFWTTALNVRNDGPKKVRDQFSLLDGWNCNPEDINVTVWLPAGYRTANDSACIQEFRVHLSDLEVADIADLVGTNLIRDPQGAALSEAYDAVTDSGWIDDNKVHPPNPNYSFNDLIEYLEFLRDRQNGGDHSPVTIRALIRSLKLLSRQAVFSGTGTPLTKLLVPGQLGILMLPHRVGHDLRLVITRLIIRRMLREREEAAQIRQRLDVETLDATTTQKLENELKNRIPRSVLAIDEAQELLGDEGGEAKEALESFCLLGRNYGLSLLLATQRPTTGAISAKVRSQVDLYLIHRLLTQDDIEISLKNLLSMYPNEVMSGDRTLEFPELVRTLEKGQLVVSGSYMQAEDPLTRLLIANIRPRITVHGGEVN
jgi:uncharacterized protein